MRTEFSDGRVGIRPYRPDDIPQLFEAVRESMQELSRWMAWCHSEYSIADSESFVQSRQTAWAGGEAFSFVIHDAHTRQFLGGVGLNFPNRTHNFANLGYWVRASRTGHGVATVATRLIARFGLEELNFQRLEIVVAITNVASQRVAQKAGARREGVLRRRLLLHGQAHDAVMFSLLAADLAQVLSP